AATRSSACACCFLARSAAAASFAFFSSAAAFCSSLIGGGAGSFAVANPNAQSTRPAVNSARTVVISRVLVELTFQSMPSRRAFDDRRRGIVIRGNAAGFDVVVPILVMFLCPRFVDVAVPHCVIGAAHADRAEINMSETRHDEQ